VSKIKVLLIEDDEMTRGLYERVIKKEGYETFTASNGKEGIEVFKKVKPDIVITDKKMPEFDGMEVMRIVKSISPDTEVILITAFGEYDTAILALRRGVMDYLKKPVNLEQLVLTLGRASKNIAEKKKISIKPSLLILEDDKSTNDKLARVFEKEGYNVFTGADGEEGIEIFSQNKIDILLIDVQMPKKDGLCFLKEINKISKNCESIMITGYGDEDTAVEAMRNGAINYVRKPIDLEQLILSVQKALEKLQLRRAFLYKVRELELSEQIIAKITSDKKIVIDLSEHSATNVFNFALQLVNTIPLSFVIVDQDMNVVFTSKYFIKSYNYTPKKIEEDFIQRSGLENIGIDDLRINIKKIFDKGISEMHTAGSQDQLIMLKASMIDKEKEREGVLIIFNK